ncbi:MAG TPA: copper amine oxidase N-terminal domain-containing protein [Pseudobacteroides sp.]|uniref:copper amine oxidase N-terminal domain-containing protein n=1 Tax=Pseudobacteroides sp. TaxID=1968840 RepID=UPI002F957292
MRKFILFLLLFTILLQMFPQVSFADSPVTNTQFYEAYLDINIVKKAAELRFVSDEIARYLSNKNNPIDIKAAVINALGWNYYGKNIANEYTKLTYNKSVNELDLDSLSGSELLCIGYLICMGDYFNPQNAIPLLEKATQKINNSLTVSIVTSIVKAQDYLSYDWYKVWKVYEDVLNDKTLKQDMRPEAIEIINEYMSLYSDSIGIEPPVITLKASETVTASIYGGKGEFKVLEAKVMEKDEFLLYGGAQIPENAFYAQDAKADIKITGNTLTLTAINPGTILLTIIDSNDETVNTPVVIYPDHQQINKETTKEDEMPTPSNTPIPEDIQLDGLNTDEQQTYDWYMARNKITINGKLLIDEVPPVMENNRILVPVRAIFEALDGKVEWNEKTKTILGQKGLTKVELHINSTNAKINGKSVKLDVPAKIYNNRTFVPLRFISESLGAKVNWNANTNTAEIDTF